MSSVTSNTGYQGDGAKQLDRFSNHWSSNVYVIQFIQGCYLRGRKFSYVEKSNDRSIGIDLRNTAVDPTIRAGKHKDRKYVYLLKGFVTANSK